MASAVAPTSAYGGGSPLALVAAGGVGGGGGGDSLESFPGKRSLGQSHSDGDDDQTDRPGYVKKRRKQSKPVRIAATDEDEEKSAGPGRYLDFAETGEHFLTEGIAAAAVAAAAAAAAAVARTAAERDSSLDDGVYDPALPLNLSAAKSPFAATASGVTAAGGDGLSSATYVARDDSSPYRSGEDSKNLAGQDNNSYLAQSPSLLLPLFKQTQMQNHQLSQISSQLRIFNPEAYCDLCNREFCNKYFLKTHKANKHGLYTENQGPPLLDPLPSMAFTNYFSSNSDALESPPVFQVAKPPLNQPGYSNSIRCASASGGTKKALQTQQQQGQPPGGGVQAAKSNSNGNSRVICDICQRDFCNKYFVKRHKMKIHGITENASKDGSNDAHDNQGLNNNNTQVKTEMVCGDLDFFGGYGKQMSLNADAKEEFQNVETDEDALKEKIDKERETDRQAVSSYGFIPPSENAYFPISQLEENNKENNASSVKLKKFGVVNADAFCDICCKEYCNKYFLRTHKLKSHGIVPVDEKKDETASLNGATGNISWYQLQSTPLNLIVGEGVANRPELDAKPSPYDAEAEESVCGECGRYFQNKFLLKIHQAYTHVNKTSTFESASLSNSQNNAPSFDAAKNSEGKEEKPRDRSSSSEFSPVNKPEYIPKDVEELDLRPDTTVPEDVQRMQTLILRLNTPSGRDNTVCDVCEKDVGHYSLMENHILQEHYVLLEEIANMNEEDNSSSNQCSLFAPKQSFECPHCQKLFLKQSILDEHVQQEHGEVDVVDSNSLKRSSDSNGLHKMSLMPFIGQPTDEKQSLQTPASSFCEICKKELCNKYFMKTHMQRMHGISIENGAQIGGVVCDICNKELCSKYFLRVHKQNSHGIVDELFLPQLGIDCFRNQSPNSDSALKPTDPSDLSNKYFSHFNEVCPICNRRFRSAKWLKAHLWNDHGEEGKGRCKDFLPANTESKPQQFEASQIAKKSSLYPALFNSSDQLMNALNSSEGLPNGKDVHERHDPSDKTSQKSTFFSMLMNGKDSESKHYRCSFCPFTTTAMSFLFIHERSHSNATQYQPEHDPGQQLRCPVCFSTVDTKEGFEEHLMLHKNAWLQSYGVPEPEREPHKPKTGEAKIEFPQSAELSCRQEASYLDADRVPATPTNEERPRATASAPGTRTVAGSVAGTTDAGGECSVRCTRCGFAASGVKQYLEHASREHPEAGCAAADLPGCLQRAERTLSTLASNSGVPAVFAVPRGRAGGAVTMQPFVLEDSDATYSGDANDPIEPKPGKTFLSSLVFLPVKEKLKRTVTASFKLTPT